MASSTRWYKTISASNEHKQPDGLTIYTRRHPYQYAATSRLGGVLSGGLRFFVFTHYRFAYSYLTFCLFALSFWAVCHTFPLFHSFVCRYSCTFVEKGRNAETDAEHLCDGCILKPKMLAHSEQIRKRQDI